MDQRVALALDVALARGLDVAAAPAKSVRDGICRSAVGPSEIAVVLR